MSKKQEISEFVKLHKCQFIDIEDTESLDKVYELLINKNPVPVDKPIEYLYYGWFYQYVNKDPIKMKYFFTLGIEKKEVYCMVNLASYYLNNKKNLEKYESYMKLAVNNGSTLAMRLLAKHYYEAKKYDEMKTYYEMAIQNKDIEAMLDYGLYLYNTKDYEKMQTYLIMAAENNSVVAMEYLGNIFWELEQDDLMKKFLLLAIEKNSDKAMYMLGKYYYEVEPDYPKVREYLKMAIVLENASAMIVYADYLRHVEKNYDETEKYLLMATNKENIKENTYIRALTDLSNFYLYVKHDADLAVDCLEKAIDKKSIYAMLLLGRYYQTEKKDYVKMKELYDMVIDNANDSGAEVKFTCISYLMAHYKDVEKDDEKLKLYTTKLRELFKIDSLFEKVATTVTTTLETNEAVQNILKQTEAAQKKLEQTQQSYVRSSNLLSSIYDPYGDIMSDFGLNSIYKSMYGYGGYGEPKYNNKYGKKYSKYGGYSKYGMF